MIRSARAWMFAAPLLTALPATPAFAVCADPMTCSCTISASGIVFGTYNQQQPSPLDSVGTVTAACDSNDPGNSTFTIALSPGGSSDSSQRAMGAGTGQLLYNLYTNVTRSTIWGDDSGSGVSITVPFSLANGAAQIISIYGRIPARQNVPAGLYSDIITVTITY